MMMHTYVFLEFYIEVYMYLKILFGRMPDCLQCYRPLTSSIFAVVSCLKRFVMPPALQKYPAPRVNPPSHPYPPPPPPQEPPPTRDPSPSLDDVIIHFITTYSCNKVKPKWRDCKKYIAKLFVLNCLCVFYEEVIIKQPAGVHVTS